MNVPARISHIDIAKSVPFITLTLGLACNLVTVVWFAATLSTNLDRLTDKVITLEQEFNASDRDRDVIKTDIARIQEQNRNSSALLQEIRSDLRELVKRTDQFPRQ